MKNNVVVMMGIMIGSCAVATGPAWAQMQTPAAQPQQSADEGKGTQIMEQMNEVQERALALQEKLETIAQQAQEQNPAVQKLHAELLETYQQKLVEYGYPSETEMQKLQEMQQRLTTGAGDMDETERQQLTQQFNADVAKLQVAQEKAQRDSDVLAAQQAFEQVRKTAMRETDPEAPALERELEILQDRLGQLRQQLQQLL